jgi:hypothetical protein
MNARLSLALFTIILGAVGIAAVPQSEALPAGDPPLLASDAIGKQQIESITIQQAASRLRRRTGRVSVVLFFSTGCSLSQRLFPSFVELTKEYRRRGVDFLIFATDPPGNVRLIEPFLERHGATFEAVHIRPWRSGQFRSSLAPHGIEIGNTWTKPLVAVRDRNGRVVLQGQGVTRIGPFRAAVENALGSDREF